jgi:hypothetical protein
VFFYGPDKLEWINAIEIEAGQLRLGYVIFLHVVNMAPVSPISIDPQLNLLRKKGKSLVVPGVCTRAVVVRKILKASTTTI